MSHTVCRVETCSRVAVLIEIAPVRCRAPCDAEDRNAVAASIVGVGNVQGLMDVAQPMSQKPQGFGLVLREALVPLPEFDRILALKDTNHQRYRGQEAAVGPAVAVEAGGDTRGVAGNVDVVIARVQPDDRAEDVVTVGPAAGCAKAGVARVPAGSQDVVHSDPDLGVSSR